LWVYRTHRRGDGPLEDIPLVTNDGYPAIALVSVLNVSAAIDENRFLFIPTEVDGIRVTQVGDTNFIGGGILSPQPRDFHGGGGRADRIIIPDGIFACEAFWHELRLVTYYVEFLAEEPSFQFSSSVRGIREYTFIVPDGIRERYLEQATMFSPLAHFNFIERSEFYNNQNNNN